jgi:hypothetical protein
METDDNDNLIINIREEKQKKYKSIVKFFFCFSIFLCIIAYILIDVNIYTSYEYIINNNETISSEYKYIFIFDSFYAVWYLFIYIYIICNSNNKLKYVLCEIQNQFY